MYKIRVGHSEKSWTLTKWMCVCVFEYTWVRTRKMFTKEVWAEPIGTPDVLFSRWMGQGSLGRGSNINKTLGEVQKTTGDYREFTGLNCAWKEVSLVK